MHFLRITTSLLPLLAIATALPYPSYNCAPCASAPPCGCGLGSGEEICNNKRTGCTPLVVRPLTVAAPKPVLPLGPVASPCDCQATLVKPAIVPRPICRAPVQPQYSCLQPSCGICGSSSQNQQITFNNNQEVVYGGGCAPYNPYPVPPVPTNPASLVPADAVSVGIARQLAQESCNLNEGELSFGFRKIPKDVPIISRKKGRNFQEGDILSLNGQIVELKKIACAKNTQTLDEEAEEALMSLVDEEEEIAEANELRRISLGEIGYGPAKQVSPAFVDVPLANPVEAAEEAALAAAAAGPCRDGFQPGAVVVSQVRKPQSLVLPAPYPEPCHDDFESIPLNSYTASCTSSSQASASSKNQYAQNVYYNTGCRTY